MTKELATTHCRVLKMVFLVLFGLFFVFGEVLASALLTDDFNSYNLGNLTPQGSWGTLFGYQTWEVVENANCKEGKCAYTTGGGGNKKEVSNMTQGKQTTYFKIVNLGSSDLTIRLYNYELFDVALAHINFDHILGTKIYFGGGVETIIENSFILNAWNYITIWWDLSATPKWVKYQVNEGSEYSGLPKYSKDNLKGYRFEGSGANYVDLLQENPLIPVCDIDHCGLCDLWGCLANSNGCCWSVDECLEGACYIGGGTCGSGSNLFFCETQETCENYNGYWWEGTCSSYIQPYLPPQDTCEGLGTIEKWLCEIKNLLKGVFVPSTEKTEELRQTVDEIKQKFPMNYLAGASAFFSDVKTNVNSSSGIDFKILGKAGTVDLAFWENTAEIGGSVQTIGEIIKVFITFLIVLGFVFWAISFGKRVF